MAGFNCLCKCARYFFAFSRNIFRSETVYLLLTIILESFKLHYFSETQVSCEGRYGRYDQINVKCPSVNLLSAHLQLVGLLNNMFINPEDLKSLVAHNNCDIRKSLLNLQFWSASHGGLKMPYKRPAHLNDSSGISDKNRIKLFKPVVMLEAQSVYRQIVG